MTDDSILNGTFREECLSADWFTDLVDAVTVHPDANRLDLRV